MTLRSSQTTERIKDHIVQQGPSRKCKGRDLDLDGKEVPQDFIKSLVMDPCHQWTPEIDQTSNKDPEKSPVYRLFKKILFYVTTKIIFLSQKRIKTTRYKGKKI